MKRSRLALWLCLATLGTTGSAIACQEVQSNEADRAVAYRNLQVVVADTASSLTRPYSAFFTTVGQTFLSVGKNAAHLADRDVYPTEHSVDDSQNVVDLRQDSSVDDANEPGSNVYTGNDENDGNLNHDEEATSDAIQNDSPADDRADDDNASDANADTQTSDDTEQTEQHDAVDGDESRATEDGDGDFAAIASEDPADASPQEQESVDAAAETDGQDVPAATEQPEPAESQDEHNDAADANVEYGYPSNDSMNQSFFNVPSLDGGYTYEYQPWQPEDKYGYVFGALQTAASEAAVTPTYATAKGGITYLTTEQRLKVGNAVSNLIGGGVIQSVDLFRTAFRYIVRQTAFGDWSVLSGGNAAETAPN